MNMGITGTRLGCTPPQITVMTQLHLDYQIHELHHGDCAGADEQAHKYIGRSCRSCLIIIHPPVNPKHRAWCEGGIILEPKPYLERNRDIVDATDLLVAFPDGPERKRSGTWSTIRYTIEQNKPVTIIHPDGRIEQRNNT